MTRATRSAILSALLVCLAGSPAWADYKDFYRLGILALDAKKYDEALSNFRRASDENPLEGGDLIEVAPGRREPYVPLYQIGLAYYRKGDCARARGSWMAARMSGEVLDHPRQARVMQEGLDACNAGAPGTAASAPVAAPAPAATPPAGPSRTPTPSPAPADRSVGTAKLLQNARTELAAGRFAAARSLLEDARKAGATAIEVDELRKSITAGEAAQARGESEWQAVEAFLALDYPRAKGLLEPLLRAGTLSARGHLYLACSHAASAVLAGANGEAELRQAREVFLKARASGARFDADWRYISPRIRALLEQGGS